MPGTARPRVRIRGNRSGSCLYQPLITMATTTNRRRQPGQKADDIHRVWKEQAPDSVFGGKSLADFEAALTALKQANEDVKIRTEARSAALRIRDQKLEELTPLMRLIVKGVQAHPDHGENSPLYRAMGRYIQDKRR